MAQETLNLHSDPPAFLFRRQGGFLCAQIDEQILAPERKRVGVVRDRPAIGSQRLNDNGVVDIPGGHRCLRILCHQPDVSYLDLVDWVEWPKRGQRTACFFQKMIVFRKKHAVSNGTRMASQKKS
jgi:hypothetical protein